MASCVNGVAMIGCCMKWLLGIEFTSHMKDPPMPITGRCFCGSVTFTCDEVPVMTRACWCRDCRYLAAGNATVNAVLKADHCARQTGIRSDFADQIRPVWRAVEAPSAETAWPASAPTCVLGALRTGSAHPDRARRRRRRGLDPGSPR